jgi:pre-mRNA-processing factor 39
VQPSHNIKIATSVKGMENGHAAGEIDETTLKRGEVKYTSYFQERSDTAGNSVTVSFL